jgi:hypothetical protein
MAIVILSGCNREMANPPSLTITYDSTVYSATRGSYSWYYNSTAVDADSDGPLSWKDIIATIEQNGSNNELTLSFSVAPTEYTVHAWSDNYWNDFDAYDDFESVPVSDDTITLYPDDGYIYEVIATWEEYGSVHYGFYVTSP